MLNTIYKYSTSIYITTGTFYPLYRLFERKKYTLHSLSLHAPCHSILNDNYCYKGGIHKVTRLIELQIL